MAPSAELLFGVRREEPIGGSVMTMRSERGDGGPLGEWLRRAHKFLAHLSGLGPENPPVKAPIESKFLKSESFFRVIYLVFGYKRIRSVPL